MAQPAPAAPPVRPAAPAAAPAPAGASPAAAPPASAVPGAPGGVDETPPSLALGLRKGMQEEEADTTVGDILLCLVAVVAALAIVGAVLYVVHNKRVGVKPRTKPSSVATVRPEPQGGEGGQANKSESEAKRGVAAEADTEAQTEETTETEQDV